MKEILGAFLKRGIRSHVSQGRHRPYGQEADSRISKCSLFTVVICVVIIIVKFGCERALAVKGSGKCFVFAIMVGVLALPSEPR